MKKLLLCACFALVLGNLSFTGKFGLDNYEIYLNNKLMLKQQVNQPLNLRVLALDKAKEGDQLRFVYRHCQLDNSPGTGRSIVLKDDEGNSLQKWDFKDAGQMTIAVKDLLQAEKKAAGHQVSLIYLSHELDRGEMLALVHFK
ncbi:hypothetical protein [Mucilaginibacter panaciglaebae]|uniref:Uncharacterized protein n=1 Tax=Mucilaginibacter panaciglaebae TaxID=502331 RepID=A0ABP7WIU1_9SPHI